MLFHNNSVQWALNFMRQMHDKELEALFSFLDLIYCTSVQGSGEDKLCWKPYAQKGFDVKSYY